MIKVRVVLLPPFQESSIDLKFKEMPALNQVISRLTKRYRKKFLNTIFDKNKMFQEHIMIMRNGLNLLNKESPSSVILQDNDEIVFCAVIAGG